jgi:hypothetical protein
VIDRAYITEWQQRAPWAQRYQVSIVTTQDATSFPGTAVMNVILPVVLVISFATMTPRPVESIFTMAMTVRLWRRKSLKLIGKLHPVLASKH